jgi:hypothetical protein
MLRCSFMEIYGKSMVKIWVIFTTVLDHKLLTKYFNLKLDHKLLTSLDHLN